MSVPSKEAHAELQAVLIYGSITVLLIMALFFAWIVYKDRRDNGPKLKRKPDKLNIKTAFPYRRKRTRKK